MPPSAANTSSFCAIGSAWLRERAVLAAHSEGKDIASCDFGDTAVGPLEHQPARRIKADETASDFGVAIAHRNRLADAARMDQPIVAYGGEATAAIPLRQAAAHRSGYPRKQLLGCTCGAVGPQVGCWKVNAAVTSRRMTAAIDADADYDNEASRSSLGRRLTFNEDARAFSPVEQKVIRPFEFHLRRKRLCFQRHGVAQSERSDESELRRICEGRRIAQQQACIEIALRRNPAAAAAPAPLGLRRRSDPERPCFAVLCP